MATQPGAPATTATPQPPACGGRHPPARGAVPEHHPTWPPARAIAASIAAGAAYAGGALPLSVLFA